MEYKKKSKLVVVFAVFLLHGKFSGGESEDWCQDYESRRCDMWKSRGFCKSPSRRVQGMMRRLCFETCNFCEPPPPEVCLSKNQEKSKYGCCWDGISAPTGPDGQGCPVCENKKNRRFCFMMKDLCFTRNNHKLLRMFCPETCGYCRKAPYPCNGDTDDCQNDCFDAMPHVLCERHKWTGYCSQDGWKEYLQKNCARTCGFCGTDQCRDLMLTRVCFVWRARNRCENAGATWKQFMKENCKLTCGFCRLERHK